MKISIMGRNMEVTEALSAAVEKKLRKLNKYFTDDTSVHVTLSVEKEQQKAEITIPLKGHVIRTEQVSTDMYVSIELAEEVIERQLKKYRTKIISRQQSAVSDFNREYLEEEDAALEEEEPIRIVRTKRIGMKPMYPEDACIQMELSGHDFFVFRNAADDEINVVYRRKDRTYGLIEPE